MAAKHTQYSIYDAPPPKHWYQKKFRLGWFSAAVLSLTLLGFGGIVALDKIEIKADTLASQSTNTEKQKKITNDLFAPKTENIVDMQSVLDAWAKDHDGQEWGVVARSVEGPTFDASINADATFASNSLRKLYTVLPLYDQFTTEQRGVERIERNGTKLSMTTCLSLMIRLSDSMCGEGVDQYINWTTANSLLKKSGFNNTVFTNNQTVNTSAKDTARLLQKLQTGSIATGEDQTKVLQSLREQYWRQGIPEGCPGCVVANKSARYDESRHDVAIVRHSQGAYVLTIITRSGTDQQIAELAGKVQQKIIDTANVR